MNMGLGGVTDPTGMLASRLDILNASLTEAAERAPLIEEARRLQHDRHMAALHRVISQVEAALGKVRDGSYGSCDACGHDIPAHELATEPATTLCGSCRGHESLAG